MIKKIVKILELLGDRLEVCVSVFRFGVLFWVKNFRKVKLLGVWRFVDIFFFGGGGGGHYEIGLF